MSNKNNFDSYADNPIIDEKSIRGFRKVMAERLMGSYHNKIHSSLYRYIDIEKLIIFKEKIKKGSTIDHFIRAVALSLLEKPELNGTYDGNIYRIYKDVNLSITINTPKGLVTPVIKHVDKLSLDDFLMNKKEIISLVFNWKHRVEDILGGTFTISNLGVYEVDFLSLIINPPQVAILGIGQICSFNIAWGDKEYPEMKKLLPLSICFDHNIIVGVDAANFLQILQKRVNEPESLWHQY